MVDTADAARINLSASTSGVVRAPVLKLEFYVNSVR